MAPPKKPRKSASPHGPGKRGKPPWTGKSTEKRSKSTEKAGLADTITTPMGDVPRCQAKNRAGNQCARPARNGSRVCSMHGAGTRKREEEGTRQNPETAPITHGLTAQPETLDKWEGLNRTLQERIDYYRSNPTRLRDLDELLARLWAIADIVGERRPGTSWSLEGGESPPPLLDVMKGVAAALEKVARIEWKIRQSGAPTLTVAQAQRLLRGLVALLHEHVPLDRVDGAVGALRKLAASIMGGQDDRGGAPASEAEHRGAPARQDESVPPVGGAG